MSVRVINAEVKAQTPFYTFGPSGAMVYPITDAQYKKLSINLYVWFLATMDPKWLGPQAKHLNGRIYRISCKLLKEYIDNNRHNKKLIKEDKFVKGKFRIIIPLEMLTEVGRIDEKTMLESGITGTGTSDYSTVGNNVAKTSYAKSIDSGSVSKKGTTGEWLMKQYFEKQDIVEYAKIVDDPYGPTDIKIGYIQ